MKDTLERKPSSVLGMLNLKCLFDIQVEKSQVDMETNIYTHTHTHIFIYTCVYIYTYIYMYTHGIPWKGWR